MPYYLAEIRLNRTGKSVRSERKMGKRLIKHLVTLLLVCVLIFTSIMIVPAAVGSDWSEVITDLEDLREHIERLPDEAFNKTGPVKGRRRALCNKISAVINQIESGACESTVNKLRNDIENAIRNWINDPWKSELIEEVEDIIEKILDTEPPVIVEVWIEPETPAYNETVTVMANVTDEGSGLETVILSYSIDMINWVNVTMDLVEGLHAGEIPAFPYDTTVYYKIYAYDKAGNLATAGDSYIVGDPYAPTISYVDHSPQSPNYNQSVSVFAEVSELPSASGVELVTLSYWNGSDWTNVTMTLENMFYEATISALPFGTTVQYKIFARDYAENWAGSNVYSYEVTDKYLPIARIDSPPQGSYLAGEVSIIVYVYDDNFDRAELTIDGTFVPPWTEVGQHTFDWNTTTYPDGVYTIDLTAYDMAGNDAKTKITVTVDNTPPSVIINAPAEGSYVKGTTTVSVTGDDANFDRMELYVDDNLKQTWTTPGSHSYGWDTTEHSDGSHMIALKVYDEAENTVEKAVAVSVDNTPPSIGTPSWEPEEPYADEQVNVSVLVSDPALGSGLKSVTLWYKNKTDGEWQTIEMTETTPGNWTATIPGQSAGENVTFYIESLDNVENSAETQTYSYAVRAPPELPWALFAAIGLGIASFVATALYLWYRRRRRKKTAASAATSPQTKPVVTLYIPVNTLAGYEEDSRSE